MTDKLRALVRVDLDCAQAQVAAQGHVTVQSVHALYAVMKRANSLTAGLVLEVDMTRAEIDPEALEQLRNCSRSHHLPTHVDPLQADCKFSVLALDDVEPPRAAPSPAVPSGDTGNKPNSPNGPCLKMSPRFAGPLAEPGFAGGPTCQAGPVAGLIASPFRRVGREPVIQ